LFRELGDVEIKAILSQKSLKSEIAAVTGAGPKLPAEILIPFSNVGPWSFLLNLKQEGIPTE
jgi:hypothetical protein